MSTEMGPEPATAEPPVAVLTPAGAQLVAEVVFRALSNVISGSAPAPEPAPVTEAPVEVRARRTSSFSQFAVPSVPDPRKNRHLSRSPDPSLTLERVSLRISHQTWPEASGTASAADLPDVADAPAAPVPSHETLPAAANPAVAGGPEVPDEPTPPQTIRARRRSRP